MKHNVAPRAHIKMIPADLLKSVTISATDLFPAEQPSQGAAAENDSGVPTSSSNTDAAVDPQQALLDIMDTYGFAVISNVMSEAEVVAAEKLFDEDLFSIVDLPTEEKLKLPCFERKSGGKSIAKRWPLREFPLGRVNPAFASDYGLPQGKCAWACRSHPNVRRIYETMFHGCTKLCAGMDNVFFENSVADRTGSTEEQAQREDDLWPHADQSIHAAHGTRPCYQGILYLWASDAFGSTTVVWPKSHLEVYDEMMAGKVFTHHFCRLPAHRMGDYAREAVRVAVPRGGMILWNSKLIHQGWNLGPRFAVPVCMEPKERREEHVIAKKLYAIERGVPTTHWASLGLIHGCVMERPGGTAEFPLRTKANEWIMNNPSGDVDPIVAELL